MNMNVLTPEVKQQLKDLDLYFSDNEDFDKYFIWNSSHDDKKCQEEHEPCYEDALATPIIQVFSVTVDTSFDDDRLCEIYGSIRAMEGQNTSFNLYDRCPEDSESIQKHGTLSLIGPNDEVMFPFTGVTLDFCLRDKIREVEVIKGNVSLDSLIGEGDYFDKLMKVVIKGEHGLACVHYAIFQFGVLGTLEVAITELKGNLSGYFSSIYGSLVATYGNSRQYCCTDDDLKYFESVLLRKPSDEQIQIMVGNPIQLSRYVVVVPAYSSIRVEANLWDSNGRIIDDYIDFEVRCLSGETKFIKSQCACLQVKVRWEDAYVQFYKDRMLKAKTKAVEDNDQEEMQKKRRVGAVNLASVSAVRGRLLTEIFSVCIGGITQEIHALCGTIMVQNGLTNYYIYDKDDSCFELLTDNFASTHGPHHVVENSEFYLSLNLKDPIRDLEVSRGYLCWNAGLLMTNDMSWYYKRLCSVVRGKDGFAAVHYMIFSNAFKAHVEVRLFPKSSADVSANVCGHLVAYYRGCDYSNSYRKKYYRSRLFYVPHNNSVEMTMGSNITLSRSVVAVPAISSLYIEADLRVIALTDVGNSKMESVFGTVEFEIDMSLTSKVIKGENCWIKLSVKYER
ncbi:60 kDa jasmonate-induced protein [Bienertia sinuspersici]